MKKIFFVSFILVSASIVLSQTAGLALHDDETLKDGGAWRPAEMNVGPARSGADDKIDKMLDRSFEKSEIVIPPLEDKEEAGSGSEETAKEKDDDKQQN